MSSVLWALWSLCMHQGCLTMQSSTDGRVGGWVLSAHRSSCGSVVPLLFTTKHVGHVRHAPWRHTRAGCCVLIFYLRCLWAVCHQAGKRLLKRSSQWRQCRKDKDRVTHLHFLAFAAHQLCCGFTVKSVLIAHMHWYRYLMLFAIRKHFLSMYCGHFNCFI